MVTRRGQEVLGPLRTLLALGATGGLSDGQLLERFATDRGEAADRAFATLVERHAAMTRRACRAVLRDDEAAEDAVQATFLVLARRARSLWVEDSLGPWLHAVAHRTARCARASIARRRRHETAAAALARVERAAPDADLLRAVHEEVARLPDRYRAAVVLCDLESTTHEQAARHLGWPIGTVKSRLSRARDLLRDRLRRRGLAPDLGLILARPALSAATDPATAPILRLLHARPLALGAASALSREVLMMSTIARWWKVGSLLAVALATAGGVAEVARGVGPAIARGDEPATLVVKPRRFVATIVEPGRFQPSRTSDVVNEVEGSSTIVSILPEGSKVKKGDHVCELDTSWLRDELTSRRILAARAEADHENARLAREVAEMALSEYTEGKLKQEEDSLKGDAELGRSGIAWAEKRVERIKRARGMLDAARAASKAAATPAEVIADLDLEDRLESASSMRRAQQLAVEIAQTKLTILRSMTAVRVKRELGLAITQEAQVEVQKAEVKAQEAARVAKLGRQIERSVLVAPRDGVVALANDPKGPNLSIWKGATVRERQVIFRVVDDEGPVGVEARVRESWVDQVKVGTKVVIRPDAIAGVSYDGVIASVAPRPDPDTFFASKEKFYATRIEIAKSPTGLRPGMTAKVEIPIAEVADALVVPIGAIASGGGVDRVAVRLGDGKIEWRVVALGRGDDGEVEVKSGLRPGEAVIVDVGTLGHRPPPGR